MSLPCGASIRLRIDLAYRGRDFHGWQIQPDLRTVQGELARQRANVEFFICRGFPQEMPPQRLALQVEGNRELEPDEMPLAVDTFRLPGGRTGQDHEVREGVQGRQ